MYYVVDAIQILKIYGYHIDAEVEIKRKKLATAPYDMQGHYKVYCSYLSKIWCKLRDKISELQAIECVELNNISNAKSLAHRNCEFVYFSVDKTFCENNCNYFSEKLQSLIEERDKIAEMERDLKKTAEEDYYLR